MSRGKDYVPYGEFLDALSLTSFNEQRFTAHFGLGFYAMREWRRTGQAPMWALRAAEMARAQGDTNNMHVRIYDKTILSLNMTEAEFQAWSDADDLTQRLYKEAMEKPLF